MGILTRVSDNWVRRSGKARLMPYLFWTKVEDRATLEGSSKDAVREHFRNWINTRSVERDGPGADHPNLINESPRYRACLYVDKDVMMSASLTAYPFPQNPTGFHLKVEGHVVLIDAQYGQHYLNQPGIDEYDRAELESGDLTEEDLEEGQYEPIEGKTEYDVGWQYIKLELTATIYDQMCHFHDAWIQPNFYTRPPAIGEGGTA
ncbi:hypothetical protein QBC47DRAFT_394141 [Echria macrotheca]|uniref:Uncharacterized protein n=1 Tax=Echria macrotheca TaxID=438768 RepID=A0AAJ0B6Y8_9PEZI|nr:hypothetical protein QBC47DRAFT_394141 [Echria macrotheca]